jgi:hypothetical protein
MREKTTEERALELAKELHRLAEDGTMVRLYQEWFKMHARRLEVDKDRTYGLQRANSTEYIW